MKYLFLFAWIVFVIGIAFQFLQFPFGGFLLFMSSVFLWIHALVYLGKNRRENLPASLLYLAVAALTTYCMCRLQYFAWAKPVYYLAILLTVTCLVLQGKKKLPFQWPQFLLLIYFAFIILLAYTPSYRIFYLVRLNSFLNSETRNLDYRSWDKYSWFLYIRDKQDEALDANKKARQAVQASLKDTSDRDPASFASTIELHALQIKEKKWESYP